MLWTKSDAMRIFEVSGGIVDQAVYRVKQFITPPDCRAGPKLALK
jgi:hypothetical protein